MLFASLDSQMLFSEPMSNRLGDPLYLLLPAPLRVIKLHMAGPTIATVQKILEGIIVPEMQAVKDRLASIEDEIKSLHSEIKRLDDKIDNGLTRIDNKIDTGLARLEERIARLDDKLTAQVARLDEKLTFTNKRLDEALEIRERLAALEAKLAART